MRTELVGHMIETDYITHVSPIADTGNAYEFSVGIAFSQPIKVSCLFANLHPLRWTDDFLEGRKISKRVVERARERLIMTWTGQQFYTPIDIEKPETIES